MEPLVNVWITTYNHKAFIAEALESVLMQQTSFDYKIILGDDFSTDGTREIILQYQEKYPDKFELFFPDYNLGMFPMFKATYEMCTARYIAWLDGDDYWTDPQKLQKQVDFLELNPEFVMSFHHVKEYYQETEMLHTIPNTFQTINKASFTIEDFVHIYNPVYALSVLHRNILGTQLPEWYFSLPFPDLGFYFLLLQHGKAKSFEEVMGVYRIHKGGAWSSKSDYINGKKTITFFRILNKHLPGLNKKRVKKVIHFYAKNNLKTDLKAKNLKGAFENITILLKNKY